jgi:hypothetical protein
LRAPLQAEQLEVQAGVNMTSYLNTHPSEAWIGLINPNRTLVTAFNTQYANDTAFASEWRWQDQLTQPIFPYPSLNGNSTHLWSAWSELFGGGTCCGKEVYDHYRAQELSRAVGATWLPTACSTAAAH